MAARGRRIAVALVLLALVLAAGRWAVSFLADRWWEAAISPAAAVAGRRRGLQAFGLAAGMQLMSMLWLFGNFALAAHIALPRQLPPESEGAPTWPARLPRWSLAVVAVFLGTVLGSGAEHWLDPLLLKAARVSFGIPAAPLGADFGFFLRDVPLRLEIHRRATLLVSAALVGSILLYLGGAMIRIIGRRVRVSPRARGHLAVLLAIAALVLGLGAYLEPLRLAAGTRGPLLPSEFLVHRSLARLEAAAAVLMALLSLLWWLRDRGTALLVLWSCFLLSLVIEKNLAVHPDAALADPTWQLAARGLDSVAYQLAGLDLPLDSAHLQPESVTPSLWDGSVLAQGLGGKAEVASFSRGWIPGGPRPVPVWLTVRRRGAQSELLAISEDRVSERGLPESWSETDSLPSPELPPYRSLPAGSLSPLAPTLSLAIAGPGVSLDGWLKRVALAWALQAPAVLTAPPGTRVNWRLDPANRLQALAPFAHWSVPRPRLTASGLVWQSDGVLRSTTLPASLRVERDGQQFSMVRSTFMGVVDARSGAVRVFQRDTADSLASAWARIARPLIEPPAAIPGELRSGEAYPDELLMAQVQALEGPAWRAGTLSRSGRARVIPPAAPGGDSRLIPFRHPTDQKVGAILLARRTARGDQLRLMQLDSLWTLESSTRLEERWQRFPFQQSVDDSVKASGGALRFGEVRYARSAEGIVAYRPAWAVDTSGRARLALVSVGLGRRNQAEEMSLGIGRTMPQAWLNFRNLLSPTTGDAAAQRLLQQIRALMRHADSALKHGDLQERERTLSRVRDLLNLQLP